MGASDGSTASSIASMSAVLHDTRRIALPVSSPSPHYGHTACEPSPVAAYLRLRHGGRRHQPARVDAVDGSCRHPNQALEANTHNQRLLEQIPVTETERKALAGDQAALRLLIEANPASEAESSRSGSSPGFVPEITPACTAGRNLQLEENA